MAEAKRPLINHFFQKVIQPWIVDPILENLTGLGVLIGLIASYADLMSHYFNDDVSGVENIVGCFLLGLGSNFIYNIGDSFTVTGAIVLTNLRPIDKLVRKNAKLMCLLSVPFQVGIGIWLSKSIQHCWYFVAMHASCLYENHCSAPLWILIKLRKIVCVDSMDHEETRSLSSRFRTSSQCWDFFYALPFMGLFLLSLAATVFVYRVEMQVKLEMEKWKDLVERRRNIAKIYEERIQKEKELLEQKASDDLRKEAELKTLLKAQSNAAEFEDGSGDKVEEMSESDKPNDENVVTYEESNDTVNDEEKSALDTADVVKHPEPSYRSLTSDSEYDSSSSTDYEYEPFHSANIEGSKSKPSAGEDNIEVLDGSKSKKGGWKKSLLKCLKKKSNTE